MAESVEQKVARLMAQGLDHYGQDRVEHAVACWREVIALRPEHRVARDYLEAAGFGSEVQDSPPDARAAQAEPSAIERLGREARELVADGDPRGAFELLESRLGGIGPHLELQGLFELLRAHLYTAHRARLRDGSGVPGVCMGPDEILRFNLPANAGFVLSMIDGTTSIDEVVSLSGMDPFEALDVFVKLLDAGIVEVHA